MTRRSGRTARRRRGRGRADDLGDELSARGLEQHQLREGIARAFLRQEHLADALAERRAAGLAGDDNSVSAVHHALFEGVEEAGLAGAFAAFEDDERALVCAGHTGLIRGVREESQPGRADFTFRS